MNNIIPNGKLVRVTARMQNYEENFCYNFIFDNNLEVINGFNMYSIILDTNVGIIIERKKMKGYDDFYKVIIKDKFYWLSTFYQNFEIIQ